MAHPLFIEIDKFDTWAKSHSQVPQSERGGEWELGYADWRSIYKQFDDFIGAVPVSLRSPDLLDKLSYMIARDNECEQLVEALPEDALVALSEYAATQGERDSKWQLAKALPRIANKEKAIDLIERFVKDPEEYVNRQALMALAKVDVRKTELYCKAHWDRNIYGDDDEYQRMAILYSLKEIGSPLLKHYLDLARKDGRPYLANSAREIEQLP